jgi:hypothetical protein
MSRNLLTFVVWAIILAQRVAILQMNELWTNTIFSIMLQVAFVFLILNLRAQRKYDDNRTIKYLSLGLFYISFAAIYLGLMLPFLKDNCFDLCLITFITVFIANYELMFYEGYEKYTINWKRRLIIILPLAIVAYIASLSVRLYFANNPIIFSEKVMYNGTYFNVIRNVGVNIHLAVRFILIYVVYKVDFVVSLVPRKPTTTNFWLNYLSELDENN